MTIVYRETPPEMATDGIPIATVRITGTRDIEFFKQLVQRATNCWDNAPVSILEFADVVTVGRIQQNYEAQRKADYRTLGRDAK
jgi:hypothetical protein